MPSTCAFTATVRSDWTDPTDSTTRGTSWTCEMAVWTGIVMGPPALALPPDREQPPADSTRAAAAIEYSRGRNLARFMETSSRFNVAQTAVKLGFCDPGHGGRVPP